MWVWLLGNLKWLKWAAIAVAAATVLGLTAWGVRTVIDLRADVAYWRAESATWQQAARGNALTIQRLHAYSKRVEEEMTRVAEDAVKRSAAIGSARSEVQNAPPTDNAPAAPVLSRALDRLRELQSPNGD